MTMGPIIRIHPIMPDFTKGMTTYAKAEQPNTDNLFWRLLWAVLDLIFGRKKP